MADPIEHDPAGRAALVIVGAGGHGHVVADAARGSFRVLGFVDEHPDDVTDAGHPLIGADDPQVAAARFIVAVGDNAQRRRLFEQWTARGRTPASVVHAAAVVSRVARLGRGTFVAPAAVINARAVVGDDVILNTGCIVEHNCHVAAHAHVAPRVTLTGGVRVGEGCLIGAGAVVLPGVSIGARAVVGAGAVVTRDLPAGEVAAGVPARALTDTARRR